ncbi:odorant receptor 56a [Eupeodes corollae]|uniref:odorant receptor 56a n=1 Tax=Eupeodes corollae TaxID=290404 RepID=UPI002493CC3F|nr:odorant receptor 56a [Eupeodes corollae]
MSAATTFLYLSTFIAYRAAFFQRERLAQMLIFLQKDVDKFLTKSDEEEEKLFDEMHSYIKVITVSIWAPTTTAALIAYIDGFYRIAIGSYWDTTSEKESYTPPLLSRLYPFKEIAENIYFGIILPMYALFIGCIAIPLWHTFITSLMSYVNLKWKIMHKRIIGMDIQNSIDTQPLLTRLFPFREVHDDLFVGYILPLYALFLGIMMIPLWHTFITGMMSYVNLKWRIMHKRLSTMDVSKVILEPNEVLYYSTLDGAENKNNFLRERMCKFSVVEQIRIHWFACELQELIGVPVFADFIIFSILICFLFYELVTGNPTKMDFVFMCLYLFVMSSILWLYHWHATLMKENSLEMGFAIYSCDWYNYPIKIQKIIQLAMTITARPLEIKAVLVPLSLTTFIDIIRAAYSYFSLLRKTSD